MAALLAIVALETGLGLDVPGVALGKDWRLEVMYALGLGTLRHGIRKSGYCNARQIGMSASAPGLPYRP
jgi:hypothetical protein